MENLTNLFSAYFYEAWDEYEYESWQDAVDDFSHRSPGRVGGAELELRSLLAESLTDAELGDRLRQLGCTYLPDEGDRSWLGHVLDRLRSASGRSEA